MIVGKGRLESLDSLRGIAALTVVYSHMNLDYLHMDRIAPMINRSFLHVFYDGEAAVIFFFVLSGFVLSLKYFKDDKFELSYPSYLISRICRIYPILWFVLGLTAILGLNLPHHFTTEPMREWTLYWWGDKFDLESFLRQMTIVRPDPIIGNNYIPQAWTLRVEVSLSLLVPFLILIGRYSTFWLILFNVFILSFTDMGVFIMHFTMGILLAKNLTRILVHMSTKSMRYKITLLLAGVLLYSYRYSVASFFPHSSYWENFLFGDFGIGIDFIIGLGVVMVLTGVLSSGRIKKALSTSIMLLIGRISYSLYLSHLIIFVMLTPLLILMLNKNGITSPMLILPLALIFTTLSTVTLAYMLYSTIEVWSIKMGKRASNFWLTKFSKKISA